MARENPERNMSYDPHKAQYLEAWKSQGGGFAMDLSENLPKFEKVVQPKAKTQKIQPRRTPQGGGRATNLSNHLPRLGKFVYLGANAQQI